MIGIGSTIPRLAVMGGAGVPPSFQDAAWYADHKTKRYFRNSGSGLLPVTFSDLHTYERASTATYFDASGTLRTAAVDEPRYDYDPATGQALGLLVEESSTNLLSSSQDFTSWSKGLIVGTLAVDAIGPDGSISATTLVDNNAGGSGNGVSVSNLVTVAASTEYTFSCFIKADGLDWAYLFLPLFTTPANGGAYFNLASGSIGTVHPGFSAKIEDAGGGWYRCSVSFTTDVSDTTGRVDIWVAEGDEDYNVPLNGTSSIKIYGAQLELGSVPTSYIPTAGSPVTRAADVLTRTPAQFPFASMPSALSLHMQGRMTYADNNVGAEASFVRWQLDSANRINTELQTNVGTGRIAFYQSSSGTLDAVAGGSYTPGINVPFSIASRHGATFINGAVDGTVLTANLTPTSLPDLSATTMQVAPVFNGHIAVESGWVTDIGDTRLGQITA